MSSSQMILCGVFALCLAGGQILFKMAALSWNASVPDKGPFLSVFSPWLAAAGLTYGATAFLWLYILRSAPLNQAYLFSIAGSALVPIAAYVLFKEPVSAKYWAGFILTLLGIYLCIS
jgi:drug/metabolite transporter (DMT)-like permease